MVLRRRLIYWDSLRQEIGTAIKLASYTEQQRILCITHTVEHNYISPSSTVRIQLHVSALYVGHLQVVI